MPDAQSKTWFARLGPKEWLIFGVGGIGFAFDTYVLLILSLVVQPALAEVLPVKVGSPIFNMWVGRLFYIPAVCGGVFGLLGGYLIDRLGRRRLMFWSIVFYGVSTAATALATSAVQLLVYRCMAFVGVSIAFVSTLAWLAELFTEREEREGVIGYAQAFGSTGGLLVSGAYYLAVTSSARLPMIHGEHAAWRYTLLTGLIPAVLLLVTRPFLPESPIWLREKTQGKLKRPSFSELFSPELRKTALLTTLMTACAYAGSFGTLQHVARIVPGLPAIRNLSHTAQQQAVSGYQALEEFGGLFGRLLMAYLVVRVVNRKRLLQAFILPGLVLVPLVFFLPALSDIAMSRWGIFGIGVIVVAQFTFWGNYLPMVYPTHLRGTGEGLSANVGGRMLGTSAAMLTTWIADFAPGGTIFRQLAFAAGTVGLLSFAVGLVASFWLPEPPSEILPN
ncbi:MAG TPA: MFS transporter [Bryobacteraceae bacterium]|nr:MFS transporter [Bryobacteraceae bacterium]